LSRPHFASHEPGRFSPSAVPAQRRWIRWAAALPCLVLAASIAGAGELAEASRAEADLLIDAALASDGAWEKITELCDGIGHRLSGSSGLSRAVDWAVERMELDGLSNVQRQRVMVPHWERGEESTMMVEPRRVELAMLGLGRSVGTRPSGITAPVIVVPDWEAFEALPPEAVRGRIVLWDAPFTQYSETVKYRWEGAATAATKGAVASLVRTVGRGSLRSPHTGAMAAYEEGQPRIPGAAISIEDSKMIARLSAEGQEVKVRLKMGARTLRDAESANVIGEVPGRELPHEIVVIGGHLDSWDVGQGAHDDAGGCIVAMEAARLMVELGLRPRRTVRVVLWTNEENGTKGAKAYRASVENIETHHAAIESDGGVEAPWGFGVSVWKNAEHDIDEPRQERVLRTVTDIAALLQRIGADSVRVGGGGADISPLMEEGVPGLALRTPMDLYWDIHHSHADTVDKIDPRSLQQNVAVMAVMAYVLADMPGRLE
jgi:carboxypeptidase Q